MFISFRETFFPTEEEKKRQDEALSQLFNRCVKDKACVVCRHWSYDETVPAFVTYEGDCDLGLTPFFGRKEDCEHWDGIKERDYWEK